MTDKLWIMLCICISFEWLFMAGWLSIWINVIKTRNNDEDKKAFFIKYIHSLVMYIIEHIHVSYSKKDTFINIISWSLWEMVQRYGWSVDSGSSFGSGPGRTGRLVIAGTWLWTHTQRIYILYFILYLYMWEQESEIMNIKVFIAQPSSEFLYAYDSQNLFLTVQSGD